MDGILGLYPKLVFGLWMMGFKVSFDTKDWEKYWFQEPNNVSMTIKPYRVLPNKLGTKFSIEHAQDNVLVDLMLKYPILFISLNRNNDFTLIYVFIL